MKLEIDKKGVKFPQEVVSGRELSRIKITSGCYSTCEVECTLNEVEGQMIYSGAAFG